jgi:hypothetical protein
MNIFFASFKFLIYIYTIKYNKFQCCLKSRDVYYFCCCLLLNILKNGIRKEIVEAYNELDYILSSI